MRMERDSERAQKVSLTHNINRVHGQVVDEEHVLPPVFSAFVGDEVSHP